MLSSPRQVQRADLTDVESIIPGIFNYAKDPFGFKALEKAVDLVKEWSGQPEVANDISNLATQVVDKLLNTPGMTQARQTNFKRAAPRVKLKDGTIY